MKVSRFLLLAALALPPASSAQLAITRLKEIARDPYLLSASIVKDVDGDGDEDLILHGSGNHLTLWCRNDGGVFAPPLEIPMGPRLFNDTMPDLADLEGDGTDDLYLTDADAEDDFSGMDARTRTRNWGGGSFSAPEAWPGGTWPHPDDAPDPAYAGTFLPPLPGTGGKDKLVLQRRNGMSSLFLIATGGNGEFVISPFLVNGIPYQFWGDLERHEIRWLDVDADGDFDMLRSDPDFGYLEVYRNRGDDTFDAGVDAVHQGFSTTLLQVAPVTFAIPGRPLPSVIHYRQRSTSSAPYIDRYLTIRAQTSDESGYRFEAENAAHRISFGRHEVTGMTTVAGAEGQELWVRVKMFAPEEPLYDQMRAYRYDPANGWVQFVEQTIPARGYGDLQLLRLTPGVPQGVAVRMGGQPGNDLESQDCVLWASLDSLRAGTPAWQTIAGPFNDFKDIHLADLDADGKLDLLSGERDHGLSYGRSGRFHLIHDIEGERARRVIDTESTENFGFFPLPGNRAAIGDIDGDQLPDLAVSDGLARNIFLLKNLGNRSFAAPETRATGDGALTPMRVGSGGLLFQNDGQVFTQAAAAGSPSVTQYDLGTTSYVVRCDMDNDGDQDVVAFPCPLGTVTGWGEMGPLGEIAQWHLLSSEKGREIRTSGGLPSLGWISYNSGITEFKRVTEGIPGIASSSLPDVYEDPNTMLWPPLDLDGDGDFDRLALSRPPASERFPVDGSRHLCWIENSEGTGLEHPQPLLRTFITTEIDHGNGLEATLQTVETEGTSRVLFGTGAGEIFLLDFGAPIPGGSFGAWLASFGLSGATATAEADPDGDGLDNLEEALLGSSPISPTPGGFRLPVSLSGAEGWSFSSALALAGSGVKVTTETSDDLDEWTVLANEVEPSGERDGRFLYQVQDEGIGGEERRFVRFKFTWEAE